MPGRDGTGPAGAGPMTGWAMGPCAQGSPLGVGNPMVGVGGRGCGFGRGGHGRRNLFRATGLPRWARGGAFAMSPTAQGTTRDLGGKIEDLRRQAQSLEGTLAEIRSQLERLEAGSAGKDVA